MVHPGPGAGGRPVFGTTGTQHCCWSTPPSVAPTCPRLSPHAGKGQLTILRPLTGQQPPTSPGG